MSDLAVRSPRIAAHRRTNAASAHPRERDIRCLSIRAVI